MQYTPYITLGIHMIKQLFLLLATITIVNNTTIASTLPERYYQNQWCYDHHGQAEVMLPDQTRADCITATHAIEFDFGRKWAESLGQALYYSLQTSKRAGIVLILERPEDRKYFIRLNSTIQHFRLPVDTWELSATSK